MNNNTFYDAPDSELISSMTGPDVQLDLNKQTNDLYVLQGLTYLAVRPSSPLQEIINAIKQNPLDSPSHQKLESYLFNRYQATVQQYRQHLKSLSTQRQNVLTSQSDSCSNCALYQEQLQKLQEEATKPCMSCIQLKNNIKSVVQQISNTQSHTLDKLRVQQDLQHIFNHNFNTPANYESNNPELLSAQNNVSQLSQQIKQLENELKQTRDSLDLIQQTSNEYLNNVQLANQAQATSNNITEITEVAVVNAFNRATTLLQEKDQQITQLTIDLRKVPIQQQQGQATSATTPHGSSQPNILRNYSPNNISNQLTSQQQDNQQPNQGDKRLFYELLGQNLYELQTPSDDNEYFNNYNTRAVTVRKSISDLLRETLQMMARSTGRADLNIESLPRAPPPYVRQQLTDQEAHYLEEVERLGNLALAVRYCISSCIDRQDEQHPGIRPGSQMQQSQKQQGNLPGNPTDLLTLQATAQKSLSQILKSLFNINLWPDHQSLKKSFGLLQSQELADQVARHCTNIPENFVDKQILIDLSDVFHNLPRQGLGETLETLQNVLFEASTRTRLVPLNVADLAPIAIDLEEQNKELTRKAEETNQENQTLKEIVKQSDDEKKDLLKQITTKDMEINKHLTELKEQKNEIQQLQLENSRIPSLQEQIKAHIQKIEDISFKNSQLEQSNKNLETVVKKQEENLEKQGNQIQSQKELISNQQNRLDQFEMRYNDVVQERTNIMQKNRELVLLAKNLEQRITEQEQDIIQSKKIIGQEMPILQENVVALKKLNTDLTNQLDDLAEQKRKLFVTTKDYEAQMDQQEAKIKSLQTQFNEANDSLSKTVAENRKIEEEINHLTQLFLEEQSKAKLLGDNLDKVSAQNVEYEKQHVNDVTEVEKLRYDLNQNTILLEEANTKILTDQKEMERLTQTNLQLTKEITQNNDRNVKNEAENQLLRTQLSKLEQEYEHYQQKTTNEIAIKQKMLDDMTTNMTQLTYMTNNAEGTIGGLIKTQYNQEIQKYLDLQQDQFNQQIKRMDEDNNILIQELTTTKQRVKQLTKENKQLTTDIGAYKEQLAKFQEVQEPLVAKTIKLLKSVSQLKDKCLFFVKTLERLSAAAGTSVQYYGSLERVLEGAGATNDMTLTALGATAATERKTRTADVLKLAEPTEDQLQTLCQLIYAGLKSSQKDKEIAELKKTIKNHEKTINELQEKIETLNKRLQEQYNKVLDATNKATQQEHTIQMLTQNLNLSRQMLRDQNIEDTLGDIKEKVSESFRKHSEDTRHGNPKSHGKPSFGRDIPGSDSEATTSEFIAEKPAMRSSNMHGTRNVQFQQTGDIQGPAIYEPSESVFGGDAYNMSIANRYGSQARAQPVMGLTEEEKGHIDRLLRENGDRVRGYSKPSSVASGPEPVLPSNVFVSKK